MINESPASSLSPSSSTSNENKICLYHEAQNFCDKTTVHGPKRIFHGNGIFRVTWLLIVCCSASFLIWQTILLIQDYITKPTATQISIIAAEEGQQFPDITICNYNTIRKSYIQEINATGDFSPLLLRYIMLSYLEPHYILTTSDRKLYEQGQKEYEEYQKKYDSNFTVNGFLMNAGFACSDLLKLCTFGGQIFDCCKYTRPILTDLGKCQRIILQNAAGGEQWLKKQQQSGVNNGLQVIADVRQDEEMDFFEINDKEFDVLPESIPLSQYEKGFRFYVHSDTTVPYLATDGITISPGSRIYSSVDLSEYQFLEAGDWGNCTKEWPKNLQKKSTYSASKCKAFCHAEFFYDKCNCTPFIYNLDKMRPVCTALDVYTCVKGMNATQDDRAFPRAYKQLLKCHECAPECSQSVFNHMNSYGAAFSKNSLTWLEHKNSNWTEDYIKNNFVSISVFYGSMTYTSYQQVKSSSWVLLISSIGGNMGMCMGISFISITELSVWIFKSIVSLFSSQRRKHIVKRWKNDKTEKELIKKACKMAEESWPYEKNNGNIIFGSTSTVEKL